MRESRSDVQGDVQLDFCSGVEMRVTQSPTNSETRKPPEHESALESLGRVRRRGGSAAVPG